MELERDEFFTIEDLNGREIEALLELDSTNDEFEIDFESDERDKLIDLKAELELRREIYSEFCESTVKGVIRDFIEAQNLEGVVSFEARLKRDKSVKNSLDRKDIKLANLKDYLGLRFITKTRDDAYTVAELFVMNHCVPRGLEEELEDEIDRFYAYETRDYFKKPKTNKIGEIQYTGIHIFLEKEGKRFEMQIHESTREGHRLHQSA